MTKACKFSTINEVVAAITSLGLSAEVPSLLAISRHCKGEFLACLSLCVEQHDQEGRNKRFIQGLLKAIHSQTLAQLQEYVPEATIDTITMAAMKGPVRLMSAIEAARDDSNPRQKEALAFLRSIPLCPTPAAAPEQTPSPHSTPPSGTENVSPMPAVALRPAPDATPTKKYDSYTVYGSSFALCFNATEWNSIPGIMIDAAVQKGGSYDWKTAIHVWLSPVEVASSVAVFRRWIKEAKFDAHGAQNDKSFALEFQGSHYFAKVSAKVDSGKVRAVKISSADATGVSILFLRQLGAAYKGIPLTELLATVRATHQIDNAA